MKRQAWLVFVCVLALVSACGRRHGAPVEPPPPPPPEIEAVYPTDRARSIVYDTTIWAQFRAPLDPATVNDHTVFLKLDTRRIPCSVSYEAATRRIRLTPQVELVLRRTVDQWRAGNTSESIGVPAGRVVKCQTGPSSDSPVSRLCAVTAQYTDVEKSQRGDASRRGATVTRRGVTAWVATPTESPT